jgi:AcrR family transcriptional regulator
MPRNRQETSNRIVESAIQLIERNGFAGWGVNAVARSAGVDKVLLYRYFESLEGLLHAIVDQTLFWPDAQSLPNQSAEAFIEATIDSMRRNGLARQLIALPGSDSPSSRIFIKHEADKERWITGVQQHAEAHLSPEDTESLCAMVFFASSTNSQKLTPGDMWERVSNSIEWVKQEEFPVPALEELPTELL